MFSLQEMIEHFDIQRVSLGGPVFDTEKLNWLNGRYLRESLSDEEFMQRFSRWAMRPEALQAIVPLIKQRVERFSDVAPLAAFFLSGLPVISEQSFEHKKLTREEFLKILQFIAWKMEELKVWHRDRIEQSLMGLSAQMGYKIRDFLFPVFIAIAGTAVSISVIDSIAVLGLDITRARLRHAINVLGGISNKQLKKMEKEFADLDAGDSAS